MSQVIEIPMATREELELGEKIVKILMPYASARRRDFWQSGGRFVHYTSAEAGLKIISKKRLWLRNATAMSDYSEVHFGNFALGNHEALKQLIEVLDRELNGSGTVAVSLFRSWWDDIQSQTFIASLSEHDNDEDFHGRLSMWRAFARSSARVALVFRLPTTPGFAQPLHLFMNPVAYFDEDRLGRELRDVQASVLANKAFLNSLNAQSIAWFVFFMLVLSVVCLKHEGFKEEREWRVVYFPERLGSKLITSSTEVLDGVPQSIHSVPLDGHGIPGLEELVFPKMLDRVIIGPSPYPHVMKEAFVQALREAEVPQPDQHVFVSGIPIRT